MTQPTPEEAAAALRAVQENQDQVIRSAATARRWPWIAAGVLVFAFCTANDLFPAARVWLSWALLAFVLVMTFGLRSRVGGTLLGQSVRVSPRSVSLVRRLIRTVVLLGGATVVSLAIALLHVPHGQILYGALAGLYIVFLGPRFQVWMLSRRGRV